jgi:serine phosphatase RsbU (regulator of sigma subunit)/putative methionine-R-sulfoxide reductase with GAF domain
MAGVVDVAAILALGSTGGAVVAALSGFAHLLLDLTAYRELTLRHWVRIPFFGAGLRALMVLLSGELYRGLGGVLPLSVLEAQTAPAVSVLFLAWFGLGHLGWGLAAFLQAGQRGLRLFLQDALYLGVLTELLPLPLSLILALVYSRFGWAAFSFVSLVVVILAALVRRWADCGDAAGQTVVERSTLELRLAEERKRSRQLETIGRVSRRLKTVLALDALIDEAVHLIRDQLGYDYVAIYTVDVSQRTVRFEASAGREKAALDVEWGQGLVGQAAADAEAVTVNDVGANIRGRRTEALDDVQSEMAVPLLVQGELLGVLHVQSDQHAAFGNDGWFVLETLGDHVALAMQAARLYEGERRQAWLSTALLQVADSMSRVSDFDAVLTTLVRLTPILAGVDRCAIVLWDPEDREYRPAQSHGMSSGLLETFQGMVLEEGMMPALDLVRWKKDALLVNSARDELLIPRKLAEAFNIEEMLLLPLLAQGEFLGVMMVDYAGRAHPSSQHLTEMLTGIAQQASMVIQSARLLQARQEEAYISTALLQVAEAVSRSAELEETLGTVARITPMLVGVNACAFLLREAQERLFLPAQQYGLEGEAESAFWRLQLDEDHPLTTELVEGKSYVAAQDLEEFPTDAGFRLALPLITRGELVGIMGVDHAHPARGLSGRWLSLLTGIASQASMAVENARLLQQAAERERMRQELEVAERIQVSFLPERCPHLQGWQFSAIWRPAREVGGDFYDFIPLSGASNERLGLVMADVADKGVPAALFMALSRSLVRTMTIDGRPPGAAIARANDLILADARSDLFVTLFYAIVETGSGDIAYVNAGHVPPLIVRSDGMTEELLPSGMALGVLAGIEIAERRVSLEPGEALILYTDGVVEASNSQQRLFGRERLAETVRAQRTRPAQELAEAIDAAVTSFSGDAPQSDDFTLLVVKRDV